MMPPTNPNPIVLPGLRRPANQPQANLVVLPGLMPRVGPANQPQANPIPPQANPVPPPVAPVRPKKKKNRNGQAENPFIPKWYTKSDNKAYEIKTLYNRIRVGPMEDFLRAEHIDVDTLFPLKGTFRRMSGNNWMGLKRGEALAYACMKVQQRILNHRANGIAVSRGSAPNLDANERNQVVTEINNESGNRIVATAAAVGPAGATAPAPGPAAAPAAVAGPAMVTAPGMAPAVPLAQVNVQGNSGSGASGMLPTLNASYGNGNNSRKRARAPEDDGTGDANDLSQNDGFAIQMPAPKKPRLVGPRPANHDQGCTMAAPSLPDPAVQAQLPALLGSRYFEVIIALLGFKRLVERSRATNQPIVQERYEHYRGPLTAQVMDAVERVVDSIVARQRRGTSRAPAGMVNILFRHRRQSLVQHIADLFYDESCPDARRKKANGIVRSFFPVQATQNMG